MIETDAAGEHLAAQAVARPGHPAVVPDPRSTVPLMAELSERHPRLDLLNLEATAMGRAIDATVLLSVEASRGLLPEILDVEDISWRTVEIE